ncbi:hypothetical protein M427DRAFT_340500 [Gonapodya prolifera JEL478]|uniref:Uncharacterized protein n=1 Tax=Gonapodya prolifera (strain JEL478) TaxID=1344416 RepID=A0A139ACZ7_GONPJ|nr:hypothetical protein M427DRAFT_340500 [Gonapodya prolifera JEL478]|eukprot:KXS14640.1 hypothetical protein M427DRAFT_340500 [Gonapodya prolifera JEL478]
MGPPMVGRQPSSAHPPDSDARNGSASSSSEEPRQPFVRRLTAVKITQASVGDGIPSGTIGVNETLWDTLLHAGARFAPSISGELRPGKDDGRTRRAQQLSPSALERISACLHLKHPEHGGSAPYRRAHRALVPPSLLNDEEENTMSPAAIGRMVTHVVRRQSPDGNNQSSDAIVYLANEWLLDNGFALEDIFPSPDEASPFSLQAVSSQRPVVEGWIQPTALVELDEVVLGATSKDAFELASQNDSLPFATYLRSSSTILRQLCLLSISEEHLSTRDHPRAPSKVQFRVLNCSPVMQGVVGRSTKIIIIPDEPQILLSRASFRTRTDSTFPRLISTFPCHTAPRIPLPNHQSRLLPELGAINWLKSCHPR